MKPFEYHLFLYEKKKDQSPKKNGARVIKGAEPSEFGHKVGKARAHAMHRL